ncbi:MAG TPA: carboxypeptidase M32 [Candidatus Acidoferrales bacterium]|nr:carboxypeptidase M32 [Candidatus Acidoferrales bacterium]
MKNSFSAFQQKLIDIAQLKSAFAVLNWDKDVFMPPKGSGPRAAMLGYLAGELHDKVLSQEFRDLLREAKAASEANELSAGDRAIVREVWRDVNREEKLPVEFVKELAQVTSEAYHVWMNARKQKDFKLFAPHLTKIVALKRREAELIGYKQSPYDALLDTFEPYATTEEITVALGDLRNFLAPFLVKIKKSKAKITRDAIAGAFDIEKQKAFCTMAAKQIGYDFDAGRLDVSAHPFSTTFHPLDSRITTRYDSSEFMQSISGVIHETGHGLYEQGLPAAHFGTPLAEAVSHGIHESQSRLWENLVGKSRPFWAFFYPLLQNEFPTPLQKVSLDSFYRSINTVEPSFIRVEADEVTYNLHIIVRFEIEIALVKGDIAVEDLPQIWNSKMKDLLGLDVPDDSLGVLQDVHWSGGMIGYFPTYSLGNLYSAQFFAAARRDIPTLEDEMSHGEFSKLLKWLREKIHVHGKYYSAQELAKNATGEKLNSKYFAEYISRKYGEIYEL